MKAACNYPPSTFLMSPSWKNLSHEKQSRKSCYTTIRASSTKLANASTKLANGVASPTHLTDFTLTETRNQNRTQTQTQIQTGRFGKYGGKYVPELLISCLSRLEDEFNKALDDPKFKKELAEGLRDYVGRETPLYYAERLTEYYKDINEQGPEIYLKREDLNYGGGHNINNALAQSMLAKRMGCTTVITATGAGQHGVATAAACAKLGLQCTVIMGQADIERRPSAVGLIKLLGAQVKPTEGSFKEASSEAIREWVGSLETSYYSPASVIGPHPCPMMVREFQSVIGKEVRRQAMVKWGGLPDVLVACVGGGSNAMGLFHEFRDDEGVRLVGVEAAGCGLWSGRHSATLAKGDVGVYQGTMSYLLQDDEGQILHAHSIATGLECPGVGPELSYLKDSKRAEFYTVTDEEAIDAYKRLCRLEGIFPALEASHALAYLEKLCPTLPHGTKVVVNCSGRGDKDASRVLQFNYDGQELKQPNAYDQIGENQYLDVPKKNSRNGFAHSLPKERASVLVKGKAA